MTLASRMINGTIKGLMRTVCRVDADELNRVPDKGPLIVLSNHINFLEPPVYYTHLLPRPMVFFAKSESWDMKLMGKLFDMWGGIPIKRGTADVSAIRLGLEALKEGKAPRNVPNLIYLEGGEYVRTPRAEKDIQAISHSRDFI